MNLRTKFACILFIIIGISSTSLCFSEEQKQSAITFTGDLIEAGLFANKDRIEQEALNLTNEDKLLLYDQYNISPVAPYILNTFLGFGIGSFMEKDYAAGFTLLATDLTFCTVALCTTIVAVLTYNNKDSYTSEEYTRKSDICRGIIYSMACANVVCSIIGGIRSIYYAKKYNAALRNALFITDAQISVVPVISSNKEIQICLSGTLRF